MDIVGACPQRIKNEFYPANERAFVQQFIS